MKHLLTVAVCALITGCSITLAKKPEFPTAPASLLEPCDELDQIPQTTELSQLSDTVVNNYTKYHLCSAKDAAWVDWYWEQKANIEKIK